MTVMFFLGELRGDTMVSTRKALIFRTLDSGIVGAPPKKHSLAWSYPWSAKMTHCGISLIYC